MIPQSTTLTMAEREPVRAVAEAPPTGSPPGPDRPPADGVTADAAARLLRDELAALQTFVVQGARVWPGGALSFVGVLQLGLTMGTEVVASSTLGPLEFVTSAAIGLVLCLAGPLVISRNVAKRDEMVQTVAAHWEERASRFLRPGPATEEAEG